MDEKISSLLDNLKILENHAVAYESYFKSSGDSKSKYQAKAVEIACKSVREIVDSLEKRVEVIL